MTRTTSLRRRLLIAVAPITLLTLAAVAIAVGRISRHVATPVVCEGAGQLLRSLAPRLEEQISDPQALHAELERFVVDPLRSVWLITRDGRPWVVVGTVTDAGALASEGHELLAGNADATAVRGFGPIHARLIGARTLDDHHAVVFERRLHGLWTPYTSAATGIAVAVLLIGLGAAVVLTDRLYRPLRVRLRTLEQALVGYGRGSTDTRLTPTPGRRDEFDQVFEAFNRMADRIAALERERRARVEAERALLADLAHDLNTPMTVLRGYAETLLERGDRLDSAARRGIATEILGQSLYVQAIVDDLLTMASARVAQLAVRPQQVALDPVVDAVVDSFHPMAAQRGVTIVGDAGGRAAWVDPVRLRQIITNLVRNALLHASGATLIEVGVDEADAGVVIWVADDGPGVPPADAGQLFERHHRGAGGAPGWGLGLAIVRTLAELHGGDARHVPRPEGGARFEVTLPAEPPAPDQSPRRPSGPRTGTASGSPRQRGA